MQNINTCHNSSILRYIKCGVETFSSGSTVLLPTAVVPSNLKIGHPYHSVEGNAAKGNLASDACESCCFVDFPFGAKGFPPL